MAWIERTNSRRTILRIAILAVVGIFVMGATYTVTAEMTSLSRSEMSSVSGREGLQIDISLQGSMNAMSFEDANGVSGGSSNGLLRFGNGGVDQITFGDGAGGAAQLEGATVDVDGSGNLIVGLPTGNLTVNVPWTSVLDRTSGSYPGVGTAGNSFGELKVSQMNMQGSDISISGKGDGLQMNVNFSMTINGVSYTDPSGSANHSGNAGSITLSNVGFSDEDFGDAPEFVSLNGISVDADGDGVIGIEFPNTSGGFLEGTINSINVGPGSIGRFVLDDVNWNGTALALQGRDDGLTADLDLWFRALQNSDEIKWIDPNGSSMASSSEGQIRLGGIAIGDLFGGSDGPVTLNGITMDFDGSQGIVTQLPASLNPIDVRIPQLEAGGADVAQVDFSDIDVGNSTLRLRPSGTGVTADLLAKLSMYEIRLTDIGGTSNGSDAYLALGHATNGIEITDSFGDPVDLSGTRIDVDQQAGLVINPPAEEINISMNNLGVGHGTDFRDAYSVQVDGLSIEDSSRFEIKGNNSGIEISGRIHLTGTELIELTDDDGWCSVDSCALNAAAFRMDISQSLDKAGGGNAASFNGMRIDADADGLVLTAPNMDTYRFYSDEFEFKGIDSEFVKDFTIQNVDPDGSWFRVSGR